MAEITLAAVELNGFNLPAGKAATDYELRVIATQSYFTDTGKVVTAGSQAYDNSNDNVTVWKSDLALVSGKVKTTTIVIQSTEDGNPNNSTLAAYIALKSTGRWVADLGPMFKGFKVPATPTSTTWADLEAYNIVAGTLSTSFTIGGALIVNGTATFNDDVLFNGAVSGLTADAIPPHDASKINSGQFADARIASAAAWNAKQNALGYAPLNPANNLSELPNKPLARSTIGVGSLGEQDADDVNITNGTIANATLINCTGATSAPGSGGPIQDGDVILGADADEDDDGIVRIQVGLVDRVLVYASGKLDALYGFAAATVNRLFGTAQNVRDLWVTGGSGTDGSPWTGWQASFEAAQGHGKTFDFPPGVYSHSSTLTFGSFHRCRYRTQGVKFVHTGAGTAVSILGGGYYCDFGDIEVQGNAGTTIGVHAPRLFRSTGKFNIHDVTGAGSIGMKLQWSVLSEIWLTCESVHGAMPETALLTDVLTESTNQECQENEIRLRIEGTSGYGVWLKHANQNKIYGSSEGCATWGIVVANTSNHNTFFADIEGNSVGDVAIEGHGNIVFAPYNVDSNAIYISGDRNRVVGGQVHELIIAETAHRTIIDGPKITNFVSDSGVDTIGLATAQHVPPDLLTPVVKFPGAVPIGSGVWLAANSANAADTLFVVGGGQKTLDAPAYKTVNAGAFQVAGQAFFITAGSGPPITSGPNATPHGFYYQIGGGHGSALWVWEFDQWTAK